MRKSHRIKCRFCAHCIPTGYTDDAGKYRDGFTRMAEHLIAAHLDPRFADLAGMHAADTGRSAVVVRSL